MTHPLAAIEEGDEWWACQMPERPPNGAELYDARCRGCVIALGAHARHARVGLNDGVAVAFDDGPITRLFQSVFDCYDTARVVHGLPPLDRVE